MRVPQGLKMAETAAVGGRLQEVVQQGNPDVGWEGDPYLELRYNPQEDSWDIWDTLLTPPALVLRKKTDGLRDLDTRTLCEKLKAAQIKGKAKGAQTILDRVNARNQAIEDERRKVLVSYTEAAAEKIVWALRKDLLS